MNARPSWPLFYTDPDADAHGILCYTITHGEPPTGLDSDRLARAEARAIVANARRADEDARSVETIANAKRAIAAAYRRALAAEKADAEARAAALAAENPQPDDTQPDAGQDPNSPDRVVAGLADVLTAALAIALQRHAGQPDAPAPGQRRPQAKTNGHGKADGDGNPGSHDRIPTPPKTNRAARRRLRL